MKTSTTKYNAAFNAGILITFPAFFLVLVCILKYTFGWEYLYNVFITAIERLGSKKLLGININALILFGPLLALVMNLTVLLRMQMIPTERHIEFQITALKSRQNWSMVILSGLLLSILFVYLLDENCNC